MIATPDDLRIEAMEYMRRMGATAAAQIEFAQFSVGFHKGTTLDQIYQSYLVAKYGAEQLQMNFNNEEKQQ